MANGLFCSESLTVSPKLRHVSNDSNSENTPPELLAASGQHCHLLCHEIIDDSSSSPAFGGPFLNPGSGVRLPHILCS